MSSPHLLAYLDASEIGGAEECLASLLEHLENDFQLSVAGVDRNVVDWLSARAPTADKVVLPAAPSKVSLHAGLEHIKTFRGLDPDIVHLSLRHPYSCQWGTVAALRTPRARVVAVEQLPIPPANARQAIIKRALSARLDAHIAVGRDAARELEGWVGLPRDSVQTIYNGRPSDAAPRRERERPDIVCLSVGRLDEQKGYDVLIDAVAALPTVTVRIVGDGPMRADLHARARDRAILDRVEFVGWLDDPTPELGAADVFVLPSRYEGLPLSIIEAMFAELAIVATDVGSVGELILDNETGLLVGPDDASAVSEAIDVLAGDAALRRRLGSAARTRALEHFSLEGMVASYKALYERLLA